MIGKGLIIRHQSAKDRADDVSGRHLRGGEIILYFCFADNLKMNNCKGEMVIERTTKTLYLHSGVGTYPGVTVALKFYSSNRAVSGQL